MGFVFKTEICPCALLLTGLLIETARCDFVLSKSKLIGLTGISPNQKQLELTLRFSSRVLNLRRKAPIKQITLAEKLPKKC